MTATAGRITIVRELDRYSPLGGRRWAVWISTYEGLDGLTLTSWDENILPPLENETIQTIQHGRCLGIWVSGRQFSRWRSPEVQYSGFEEYSRVHVPADARLHVSVDVSRVVK